MKKILTPLFLSCSIILLASAAYASLVESTFDVDADGWRVAEFFSVSGTSAPTYVATGGNPGGFIRTTDIYGWNAFLAPAKFLGDQSAAFGGSLEFDLRILTTDNVAYYAVVLEGAGLQLGYSAGIPTTDWTTFSIPLTGGGWLKDLGYGTGGVPATAADLQNVLGNLTALRIDADWQTGSDQVDLDNVRFNAVPVPPTVLLFASGLLPLAVAARRKFSK